MKNADLCRNPADDDLGADGSDLDLVAVDVDPHLVKLLVADSTTGSPREVDHNGGHVRAGQAADVDHILAAERPELDALDVIKNDEVVLVMAQGGRSTVVGRDEGFITAVPDEAQRVDAISAVDLVVAVAGVCHEQVVAGAEVDRVLAAAAGDRVVA